MTPLDQLIATTSPDGGWGYRSDQPAHLEPTALALLALNANTLLYSGAIANAWRAVHQHALPDGSYRLTRGRPQAVWPTALVLFTQAVTGNALDAKSMNCLLTTEGKVLKADPEVADMVDIDVRLMGWPWAEDTFSWVEPTSWACLALRAAGQGGHVRVQEGLRLLLDRAFDTGGANYGNRTVLGRSTEPIPGPTALLLLAMQGLDHMKIDAAKGYLRVHAEKTTDVEHLAWIKLALAVHANDEATKATLPKLDARLKAALDAELTATPGLGAGPSRLALAALALDTANRNPFLLKDTPQVATGEPTLTNAGDKVDRQEARGVGAKVGSFFRGVMVKGLTRMRGLPSQSGVHIGKISEYDPAAITALLREQFSCYRQHLPLTGKRVVLKPNLVEYHRDKVINTDPRFVDGVIQMMKDEGAAEVIVAEGPGHWRNVQYLVNESGLGDVLRKHGVRFVDINHDEPVKTVNLGRTTGLEYLYLSRTILNADVFVSLPKLKTHHWAGTTLSLKNLFGSLPGICYGWPKNELHWRGIPNSIVDIACTHTPHLAIVDGIIGMEGDGPLNGTAKPMGVIVMGTDLVAVDSTCCRLIKMPPERLPTLMLANAKRLGHVNEANIVQLGAAIDELASAFAWPPGIEKQMIPVER
ncbi:hypothetical protein BH11PLA2_BH11PLA2_25900 [soil metagenome]